MRLCKVDHFVNQLTQSKFGHWNFSKLRQISNRLNQIYVRYTHTPRTLSRRRGLTGAITMYWSVENVPRQLDHITWECTTALVLRASAFIAFTCMAHNFINFVQLQPVSDIFHCQISHLSCSWLHFALVLSHWVTPSCLGVSFTVRATEPVHWQNVFDFTYVYCNLVGGGFNSLEWSRLEREQVFVRLGHQVLCSRPGHGWPV